MSKKGWFNESARHSLAARGIRTRSSGVVDPSGRLVKDQYIDNMLRVYSSIKDLGETLRRGKIGKDINGVVGGITTNDSPHDEFTFGMIGQVILTLDPEIMLKRNDLIRIEYTPEFFEKNIDIAKRVGAGTVTDEIEKSGKISPENMDELVMYEFEEELVSRTPVVIPPHAVKRIDIPFGDWYHDPITGEDIEYKKRMTDEDESYRFERKIIKEIKKEIPEEYWHAVVIYNAVAEEKKYLRWLI